MADYLDDFEDADEQVLRNTEAAKKREQLRKDMFTEAFKDVLATEAGRLVLWELIGRLGIYQSSFSLEPLAMAFREGQRAEGLRLIQDIQLTDGGVSFNLMQREAIGRDGVRDYDGDN